MKSLGFTRAGLRFALLTVVTLLSQHVAFAGEKLSGVNIDKRTTLWFKASDAGIAKLIPGGWLSAPVSAGPFKGANATVVLINSYFASDANAQPLQPFHGFVLALPAKKSGTDIADNLIVAFGITSEEHAPGVYGVYVAGKVTIERTSTLSTDAGMTISENWQLTSKDGNELGVSLQFKRGPTTKGKLVGRTVSGARPNYYHINHIDQATEIIRSTATDIDRVEKLAFRVTGPRLSQVFDGTEQLIGIGSVPVFSRTVLVPE